MERDAVYPGYAGPKWEHSAESSHKYFSEQNGVVDEAVKIIRGDKFGARKVVEGKDDILKKLKYLKHCENFAFIEAVEFTEGLRGRCESRCGSESGIKDGARIRDGSRN